MVKGGYLSNYLISFRMLLLLLKSICFFGSGWHWRWTNHESDMVWGSASSAFLNYSSRALISYCETKLSICSSYSLAQISRPKPPDSINFYTYGYKVSTTLYSMPMYSQNGTNFSGFYLVGLPLIYFLSRYLIRVIL